MQVKVRIDGLRYSHDGINATEYKAGDIADFPAEDAESLCDQGYCEAYEAKAEAEAKVQKVEPENKMVTPAKENKSKPKNKSKK